jgi:hypothetical protein
LLPLPACEHRQQRGLMCLSQPPSWSAMVDIDDSDDNARLVELPRRCFPGYASDDGSPHIFVHPVIVDPYRVAGTVVHQCCHAALGSRSHGIMFRLVATKVGLVGKPTATIEGPLFHALVPKVIDKAGPYPHAALRQIRGMNPPKKSRLVRAKCLRCGYVIRLAQKWIDLSHPLCPNKYCSNMGKEMEVG